MPFRCSGRQLRHLAVAKPSAAFNLQRMGDPVGFAIATQCMCPPRHGQALKFVVVDVAKVRNDGAWRVHAFKLNPSRSRTELGIGSIS
jgi:hypothetical protein